MNLRKDHYHKNKTNRWLSEARLSLSLFTKERRRRVLHLVVLSFIGAAGSLGLRPQFTNREPEMASLLFKEGWCTLSLRKRLSHIFIQSIFFKPFNTNQKRILSLRSRSFQNKKPLQLQTTDALATAMMKGAAKCDT